MIEDVSTEVKTRRASNGPAEAMAFVEDMAARKGERKAKRWKWMPSQRSRVGTEGAEGGSESTCRHWGDRYRSARDRGGEGTHGRGAEMACGKRMRKTGWNGRGVVADGKG